MLINLVDLLKTYNIQELNNLKIKIVSIKDRSTIVLIKGYKVEIPYLLDKSKSYILSFDKSTSNFKIIESAKQLKTKEIFNNSFSKSIINNLLNFNEIENLNIEEYFNYFFNNSENRKIENNSRKNNSYAFKNNKKEFFFIFEAFFLNIPASIFLKIDKNRLVSLFLYLKERLSNKEKIIQKVRSDLKSINFQDIIIFDNDKIEYVEQISNILKNNKIDFII